MVREAIQKIQKVLGFRAEQQPQSQSGGVENGGQATTAVTTTPTASSTNDTKEVSRLPQKTTTTTAAVANEASSPSGTSNNNNSMKTTTAAVNETTAAAAIPPATAEKSVTANNNNKNDNQDAGNDQVTKDKPPHPPLEVQKANDETKPSLTSQKEAAVAHETKTAATTKTTNKATAEVKTPANEKPKGTETAIAAQTSFCPAPMVPSYAASLATAAQLTTTTATHHPPLDHRPAATMNTAATLSMNTSNNTTTPTLSQTYAPFCLPSDTNLAAARHRLETALQQTHQLRQAFTERVYTKYRVCLRPPAAPEHVLHTIRQNPAASHQRWKEEMALVQHEKELEKKHAIQLSAQVSTQSNSNDWSPATAAAAALWKQGSVDHADQLLYLSAGLNLIVLPEEDAPNDWPLERAPMDPRTGQRSKNISQAAATAGNVMLERKRKALGLRAERQQAGLASKASFPSIEPLAISTTTAGVGVVAKPPPTDAAVKNTAAAAAGPARSGKTIPGTTSKPRGATHRKSAGKSRSRTALGLTPSMLLNLNPLSDEMIKPARAGSTKTPLDPSTLALLAKGGAPTTSSRTSQATQQRLRHPHPESLGGLRRAGVLTTAAGPTTEPFSQANLANTLPPLPAARERLERKPVRVLSAAEASTQRARDSIQKIVDSFVPNSGDGSDTVGDKGGLCRPVTKIQLLHELRQLSKSDDPKQKVAPTGVSKEPNIESSTESDKAAGKESASTESRLDPMLTFSVLQAVGLIGTVPENETSAKPFALPEINEKNSALWSDKLTALHKTIISPDKRSFTSSLYCGKKRGLPKESDAEQDDSRTEKRQKVETSDCSQSVPVENIRGGGEPVRKSEEESKVSDRSDAAKAAQSQPTTSKVSEEPEKKANAPSSAPSPGRPAATSSAQGTGANVQRMAPPSASPQRMPVGIQEYPQMSDRYPQGATLNVMHLANRLQQQMQPTGDLADYLSTMQSHAGYDLSALMASGQASAMSPLGNLGPLGGAGMMGYSLQDRAAAARAILVQREQQAATLLGGSAAHHGYPQAGYPHVGAHPAAVSALLGQPFPHAQLGMTANGAVALPHAMQQPPSPRRQRSRSGSKSSDKGAPQQKSSGNNNSGNANAKAGSDTAKKQVALPKKATPASTSTATNKEAAGKTEEKTAAKESERQPEEDSAKGAKSIADATNVTKPAPPKAAHTKPVAVKPSGNAKNEQPKAPAKKREDSGMKFLSPNKPASVTPDEAALVRSGHLHQVLAGLDDLSKGSHYLDYLQEVGGAVPIPKALILAALKERLNAPAFKQSGNTGVPPIPREPATAAVLVWLWASHEKNFQSAFEKSGRIDVDPDCKWLIHTAVDLAVQELSSDMSQSVATGKGVYVEAAAARKNQSSAKNSTPVAANDAERARTTKRLEIHTASVVSKALMANLRIEPFADNAIPEFESLVSYLDESRLGSLRVKSQERVLLANLLARTTTITESFSHAYVSAMVRIGEAIGHGKLFEIAQNEDALVSTMIPYDIFTDETSEWEDPCKTEDCFQDGLTGKVLLNRAHARAMIHKSLRKLQDRHGIKGGATNYGPYSDTPEKNGKAFHKTPQGSSSSGSSRPSLKRRYSSISEPPAPPGTGSAKATTWSLYDPKHISEPLQWFPHHLENKPYGRHRQGERSRSLSLSLSARSGEPRNTKKAKRSMSLSVSKPVETVDESNAVVPRSTHEIDWGDVASIFQRVEVPRKSPSARASKPDHSHGVPPPAGGVIIAPFCCKFDGNLPSDEDSGSEEEEDTRDETVLKSHQLVLDQMKSTLATFLDSHKQQQEGRRKSKSSKK